VASVTLRQARAVVHGGVAIGLPSRAPAGDKAKWVPVSAFPKCVLVGILAVVLAFMLGLIITGTRAAAHF
jgi:hypothetical protein